MLFLLKNKKIDFLPLVCLVIFSLSIVGCSNEMLDTKPTYKYTEGNFWTSESAAKDALTGCYSVLRYGGVYGGDATPLWEETASPNAYDYDNTQSWNAIAEGEQSSSTGGILNSRWKNCYQGIGRCNTFLEKIQDLEMDADLKSRMMGEALFLRGVFYFMLETYWGDVPLITDSPNLKEQGNLPRTPREEVVQQILKDFDDAATRLPVNYTGGNIGRATKGAALGLKAKLLLFEASPLFNTDQDGDRWEIAIDALKEVMDLAPEAGYALYPDYRDLFLPNHENNSEVLFDVQFVSPKEGNSFDLINRQYNTNAPLRDLIDAYQMKNGLSIDDSNSGYDSDNPYKDRDSRLYTTIVYPGAKYMGKVTDEDRFSITGYGLLKYSVYSDKEPSSAIANLGKGESETNYIVLRYADILLMYAEAKNEANEIDQSVYEAINKVRERSGMPDIDNNLSKEDLREVIRNERRIEFAGEGYYYNDIRRWKIAEDVMNAPIKTFNNKIIETRSFDPNRDYWWPITVHQRDLNPNLEQTSGY